MAFTVLARAKINWSLNILGVRPNGYHELDMLMQPISLADELVFEPADALSLTVGGAPGDENDLVLKAARALAELARQHGMKTSGARICLTKRIPSRAGLGGGSADCAETLKALNRLWNLNFPMETLLELGAKLGADVPFCLTGGLARVLGIGERIEPLSNPPRCALVLITPGGGLSTPEVFRAYDEMAKRKECLGDKCAEIAVKYSPDNPIRGNCVTGHSPEALARENRAASEHSLEALARENCAVTERSAEAQARGNCAAAECSTEAQACRNCAAGHSPETLARENCTAAERSAEALARGNCAAVCPTKARARGNCAAAERSIDAGYRQTDVPRDTICTPAEIAPEAASHENCVAEYSLEALAHGNCAAVCPTGARMRGNCAAEHSPETLARVNCVAAEHSPLRLAEALTAGDYALAERLSFNALEAPAIRLLPEIGEWINRFRELGAQYVRMTGSGSTVFGVFDSLETAQAIASQIPGAIAAETIG